MIKLKKIILNNFGVYYGKHELEFPSSGLYSIVGKYENEPERSNGAGKTFLVRGIAYCLDFADLFSPSLQNYNTNNAFSVELTLEVDGNNLEIYRDKDNYIVKFDEKQYKAANAKIFLKEKILDAPLISFVTYRQQDQRGNFLPLKPSEKIEFLSNLLNLDRFQNIIDANSEKLKTIEEELVKLASEEDVIRIELFSNKEKIDLVNQSIYQINGQILHKGNDLKKVKEPKREDFIDDNKFQELMNQRNDLLSKEYDSPLVKDFNSSSELLNAELNGLKINLEDFNVIKPNLINKIQENVIVKKELALLQEKMNWLDKQLTNISAETITYPQCSFSFDPDNHTEDVKKINKDKVLVKRSMNDKIGTIESNQDYIDKFQNISILDNLIKENKTIEINLNREKDRFNSKKEQELNQINYELKFFNENNHKRFEEEKQRVLLQKQNILLEIDSLKENLSKINEKLTIFEQKKDFFKQKNIEVKSKLKSLRIEKSYHNEVINCLGKENFIRLITEETLALITAKINKFLSEIPNTEKITVQLSTDKETKKGTFKKSIELKAFASGIERPFEEFSGGEKCSINLACDTAISEIIAERTGKRFGWYILDEGTNGMDMTTKFESMQVLRKLSQDKLILTIDHSNEVNEYLDGQIIVLKNNEGSTIVTSHTKIDNPSNTISLPKA